MLKLLARLRRDEEGTAAVEYGLLAALIAVASVGVMGTIGTNLHQVFVNVANALIPFSAF